MTRLQWSYKGHRYDSVALSGPCSSCGERAIVELPERVRAEQPDDTTHVCHPSLGGCNLGFSSEVTA